MNLYIPIYHPIYHHHGGHAEGSEKALLAMVLVINVILILIMLFRAIKWFNSDKSHSFFEYAIYSSDVFMGSFIPGFIFIVVNGLALFFYLVYLIVPYL